MPGRTSVHAVIFALGFASVILQSVLIREMLVVFYGNELIIGVILGAWLMWIGIGARLGAPASGGKHAHALFISSLFLFAAAPFIQLLLVRNLRSILHVPPGEQAPLIPTIVFSVLLLSVPSFLIGFTFPLANALFKNRGHADARDIGRLYIVESAGFLLGGLVFTFIIVTRLDSFSALMVSVSFLMVSIFVPRALISGRPYMTLIPLLLIASFFFLTNPFLKKLDRKTEIARWKSINPGILFLNSVNSEYKNLVLASLAGEYILYGNGQYLFSFPDPFTYSKNANFILSEHTDPESALILGDGAFDLPCEMLRYPVKRVDYVLLDKKLLALLKPHLPAETIDCISDRRMKIHFSDGRLFVNTTDKKYDVVHVDAKNPTTAATNRYFTTGFFRETSRVLTPDGVFSVGITASENLLFSEAGDQTSSLYRSLKQIFPHVVAIPGETNQYFSSLSPGVVTDDVATLTARRLAGNPDTRTFHPSLFESLVQPYRIPHLMESLRKKENVRINTDTNPVVYFYNLLFWLAGIESWTHARIRIVPALKWINLHGGAAFLSALAFLLISCLLWSVRHGTDSRGRRRFNALVSIFICGASAMSLELVVLFGYQNLLGVLYQKIALITGVFMMGISSGGAAANVVLKKRSATPYLGIAAHAAFAAAALAAAPVFSLTSSGWLAEKLWASQSVFYCYVLFCGALTGWLFPVACSLHLTPGGKPAATAGLVDSLDHVGASLGAFISGAILIPVLGVSATGGLIAVTNSAAAVLWAAHIFLSSRSPRSHDTGYKT
ncbi:MAG: fused MFS/spermidine synthase [bacterium]